MCFASPKIAKEIKFSNKKLIHWFVFKNIDGYFAGVSTVTKSEFQAASGNIQVDGNTELQVCPSTGLNFQMQNKFGTHSH